VRSDFVLFFFPHLQQSITLTVSLTFLCPAIV